MRCRWKPSRAEILRGLAFALGAVRMSVTFTGQLGPVPDQEAGVAGELVRSLGYDLDDELFRDDLSARGEAFVKGVGLVKFGDDTARVRGILGFQGFQRAVLGFLDVGADFIVIGCHWRLSFLTFGVGGRC